MRPRGWKRNNVIVSHISKRARNFHSGNPRRLQQRLILGCHREARLQDVDNEIIVGFENTRCTFPNTSRTALTFTYKKPAAKVSRTGETHVFNVTSTEDVIIEDFSIRWSCEKLVSIWRKVEHGLKHAVKVKVSLVFEQIESDDYPCAGTTIEEAMNYLKLALPSTIISCNMNQPRKVNMKFELSPENFREVLYLTMTFRAIAYHKENQALKRCPHRHRSFFEAMYTCRESKAFDFFKPFLARDAKNLQESLMARDACSTEAIRNETVRPRRHVFYTMHAPNCCTSISCHDKNLRVRACLETSLSDIFFRNYRHGLTDDVDDSSDDEERDTNSGTEATEQTCDSSDSSEQMGANNAPNLQSLSQLFIENMALSRYHTTLIYTILLNIAQSCLLSNGAIENDKFSFVVDTFKDFELSLPEKVTDDTDLRSRLSMDPPTTSWRKMAIFEWLKDFFESCLTLDKGKYGRYMQKFLEVIKRFHGFPNVEAHSFSNATSPTRQELSQDIPSTFDSGQNNQTSDNNEAGPSIAGPPFSNSQSNFNILGKILSASKNSKSSLFGSSQSSRSLFEKEAILLSSLSGGDPSKEWCMKVYQLEAIQKNILDKWVLYITNRCYHSDGMPHRERFFKLMCAVWNIQEVSSLERYFIKSLKNIVCKGKQFPQSLTYKWLKGVVSRFTQLCILSVFLDSVSNTGSFSPPVFTPNDILINLHHLKHSP